MTQLKNFDSQTLAIDFGTTNTLVATFGHNSINILNMDPLLPEERTELSRDVHKSPSDRETLANIPAKNNLFRDPTMFRTLVYFPNDQAAFYGQEALRKYIENDMEGRLFRSFKAHLPNTEYLGTVIGNRRLPLEDLVGIFLLEVRKRAERIVGVPVHRAVFGKPAKYSMDAVRDGFALRRMEKAAEFAGFTDIKFVPEPLAAALDLRRRNSEEKLILICDFGGGTSDFTVMRLTASDFKKEDVLAIHGCSLAGDAFDSTFMKFKLNKYFGAQSKYRLPLSSNLLTMPPGILDKLNLPSQIVHLKERETFEFIKTVQKTTLNSIDKSYVDQLIALVEDQQIFSFFEKIESCKRCLSEKSESDFVFEYPGIEVKEKIHRKEFESWSENVTTRIFDAMDETLRLAGVTEKDIDFISTTGGTAKIPRIQELLIERFGVSKMQSTDSFHSVINGLAASIPLWEKNLL